MKLSDFFDIGEKLEFGLASEPDTEKYLCLVKKFRESLMAVVVSNRDKDKLTLSSGDEIFLFKDLGNGVSVTPVRLVQSQAYPLVILDAISPAPIAEPEITESAESGETATIAGQPEEERVPEDQSAPSYEDHGVYEPSLYSEEPSEESAASYEEPAAPGLDIGAEAAIEIPSEGREEEPSEPMFEMDLTGEEEGEGEEPAPAEGREEEPSEPMFEMDAAELQNLEETPSTAPFESGDLVEHGISDIPEEDSLLVDTSSELFLVPGLPEPAPDLELAKLEPQDELVSDSTPLMDTMGDEYENENPIESLGITDDYLDVETVPPSEQGQEEEAFSFEDGSMEEHLDQTYSEEEEPVSGDTEVESVQYFGADDALSGETEPDDGRDETPSTDFYVPEGAEEGPAPGAEPQIETAAEEGIKEEAAEPRPEEAREPGAESGPDYFHAQEGDFNLDYGSQTEYITSAAPEPDTEFLAEPGLVQAAHMDEDLTATSRDLNAGEDSLDDIEILDHDLMNAPSLGEGDLEEAMGGPKPQTTAEAEEEEEEERKAGEAKEYAPVPHFADMEIVTARDFDIDLKNVDSHLAKSAEEEEESESITISEEDKKYSFDEDMEDTVKILAPYSMGDDSLSGFTLEDMKDVDEDIASAGKAALPAGEEPEPEAEPEMTITDLAVEDYEPAGESFGATARIPREAAKAMLSRREDFEDYFGFRYSQVEAQNFFAAKTAIEAAPTPKRRKAPAAPAGGEITIGDSVGKEVKDALKILMDKISYLEGVVGKTPSAASKPEYSVSGEEPIGICTSINPTGLMAALEGNPPPQGVPLLIIIDRPWSPPLRVEAMAELASSERKGERMYVCYFRFTAIHDKDKEAISDYVAKAPEIFKRIKRALSG